MKTFIAISILIIFVQVSFAVTRFVTPLGAGALNGSSWANAYAGNSLQVAITASAVGDEVWVAAGLYTTTTGTNRAISFSMKNDVAIYGSFIGTESLLSQRIFTNGLTSILSGEIGAGGIGDDSYIIVSNFGLNNTAIIDGFIVRDGNNNQPISNTTGLGGGIYNDGRNAGNVCSPTIRNCLITNNSAGFGGGIFNNGNNNGVSLPLILNCVIANNTATNGGGGIDNYGTNNGNASPTITNCIFYNNTAVQRAGGMYCWGGSNGNSSPIVLNTIFVNNSATDAGGVICDRLNNGAAGSSGTSNPTFRNCIFWGNTATGTGPQFQVLGGATFTATYTDIDLTGQTTPNIISGAGTGNINSNPLFTNVANGAGVDGIWFTSDDGLQLQSTSPCINVGNNVGVPSTDLLFNNRIFNTTVDMGAYEYFCTVPTQPTIIIGDTTVCIDTFNYAVTNVSGLTYLWTLIPNAFGNIIGIGNVIDVNFTTSGNATLNVYAINSCDTSIVQSQMLQINAIPTPSISGLTTICSSDTSIFTINTGVNGSSYNWTVIGGTIISGCSISDTSCIVQWGNAGTGSINVTQTNP